MVYTVPIDPASPLPLRGQVDVSYGTCPLLDMHGSGTPARRHSGPWAPRLLAEGNSFR